MITNNKDIYIHEAINQYLNWKETHTTKASQAYRRRLTNFAAFILQIQPQGLLTAISGDDVVAFHQQMKGEYSDATIAYSSRILKSFFNFFQGRGYQTLNPKEIRGVRFVYKQKEVVNQQDVDAMLELLDEYYIDDLQKALVIQLLWDTGMRLSELLGLKLEDINEQNNDGLRTAKIQSKKSFRYNIVVWGKETDRMLTTYMGWRTNVSPDNPFLFAPTKKTRNSKQTISARTIQRWIRDLSFEAMIEKSISPHCFRHGRAHFIIENEGTPLDVQAILRHQNLNSSLNYMQLSPSQYLKTAGKFLNGGQKTNLTKGFQVVPTSWAA